MVETRSESCLRRHLVCLRKTSALYPCDARDTECGGGVVRDLGAAAPAGPLLSCASCREVRGAQGHGQRGWRRCSAARMELKAFQMFPGGPEPWPPGLTPKNLNSSILLGVRAAEYKGLRNSRTENQFRIVVKLELTDCGLAPVLH